ncbi:MAG: hypothetical protein JNN04_00095 [Cyclobacteriaceae bacterium]|nr:hypothetical protein [Cyclobacteriaceae bacterium]
MKAFLSAILLFLLVHYSSAQLAIINDPDGYVNVRDSGHNTARIVGRIFEGEVFQTEELEGSYWWPVFYGCDPDRDSLATSKRDFYRKELGIEGYVAIQGFVHRSRIRLISSLPSLSERSFNSHRNSVTISNSSIRVTLHTASFDSTKHQLERSGIGNWITRVDGKKPWGQDGGMPHIQIQKLSFHIDSKELKFPRHHFDDLYEPNLSGLNLYFASDDQWFLCMVNNSDGGGAYDAVWIIKEGKVSRRVILVP